MMLQNNLLMGGRLDSRDRFSDWRLDIDNMSYEVFCLYPSETVSSRRKKMNLSYLVWFFNQILVQIRNVFLNDVKQQLLELGDKIGYVNTGLKEDEISRCLRKIKGSIRMNDSPANVPMHVDKKCSICQVS